MNSLQSQIEPHPQRLTSMYLDEGMRCISRKRETTLDLEISLELKPHEGCQSEQSPRSKAIAQCVEQIYALMREAVAESRTRGGENSDESATQEDSQ